MNMLDNKIRNTLWGTYGKDPDLNNLLVQFVPIKELSNNHILAILTTQQHIRGYLRNIFVYELLVRAMSGIHIMDVDCYPNYPLTSETLEEHKKRVFN